MMIDKILAFMLMDKVLASMLMLNPETKEKTKVIKEKSEETKKCHYCGGKTIYTFCSSTCCKEYQKTMKELKKESKKYHASKNALL
jgi:hypothetical protein